MRILQNVIEEINQLEKIDRPYIIGMDGLSGSGKTTLSEKIKEELMNEGFQVIVIHIDHLIVERAKRYNTGHPEWYEYYALQWDVQCIKENLFKAVHQKSNHLYLPFYDFDKDQSYSQSINIGQCSIILIEGVFLQRNEWKSFFDFMIYLDCPRDMRNARVLQRDAYIGDMNERLKKYERRYWKGEEYYLLEVDPLKKSDIIIRNL
ncbi:uridine kinase [Psychrobacillus glaciei]|uniref:Uridine kinase n=1 Tax=Psychrobacillus glaciei TaxID=2283160 RepID=A0A5J6SRM3_9BACI|nr:kinase [Psychrobacillus glaciei]QFG00689.1 uridine kinase [Psychrobacillus glaciei]